VKVRIYTRKMAYLVINHSRKSIYRLCDWRETFDDVMEANPEWGMKDNIDCYDEDLEIIESCLKLDYQTNFEACELPQYIRDPEFLVWYMDAQGFSLYDITRAINFWDGKPEFEKACGAIDDVIAWKKSMDCADDDGEDEMMLCAKMQTAM
jgi:hypothetical protein